MSEREPPERNPSLMGLLKYCAEAASNEDSSTSNAQASQGTVSISSSSQHMISLCPSSQEESSQQSQQLQSQDKDWLENVLSTVFKSPAEAMQEHLKKIRESISCISEQQGSVPDDLYESLNCCLESLMQYTDVIDNANDFHKLGGFTIINPLLQMQHTGIRARTLELIGDLVQNNRYCQEKVVEAGLLPKLFDILDSETEDIICVKALYAISCLCRQNAQTLKSIIEVDGFSKLLRTIQKPSDRLRTKCSFLLTHLTNEMPEIRAILTNMGVIQLLICLLHEDFSPAMEHVLSFLVALVEQYEPARQECLKPELGLKSTLQALLHTVEGEYPECTEVKDYLKNLINYCEPCVTNFEEERKTDELER